MGRLRSTDMDDGVQQIWNWAINRYIWLTATNAPELKNIEADKVSRKQKQRTK